MKKDVARFLIETDHLKEWDRPIIGLMSQRDQLVEITKGITEGQNSQTWFCF